MLTTVEGIFKDGHIELEESPPTVEQARVIVTFLPEQPTTKAAPPVSPTEANRRVLDLLRTWQEEPLTPEEKQVLDEFDAFQAQHPLRFARLDEEP